MQQTKRICKTPLRWFFFISDRFIMNFERFCSNAYGLLDDREDVLYNFPKLFGLGSGLLKFTCEKVSFVLLIRLVAKFRNLL